MPSQVAAVAVTDEVSFTAVPAKMPNGPPSTVENPMRLPRYGNTMAAITLNRKMMEMDWATSSSLALMTGAVAAMADPPQIDEPTPMSVAILPGMPSAFETTNATTSAVQMVVTMMGSDSQPVCAITPRFRPKPKSTTAVCRTYFEVKPIPLFRRVRSRRNKATMTPMAMPKIGPPTMVTRRPSA